MRLFIVSPREGFEAIIEERGDLYLRVGKLEGQIPDLATKEDIQKIKTDLAKEIGNSKEWILHRVLIVIGSAFVLLVLNPLLRKFL